jgi:hypothetical protein
MLVGIISGTYSTVFIAAAVAILLSRKKDAARSPVAPAAQAAQAANGASTRKKGTRKARA